MKLILEKWRRLLEGDVIQGPWEDKPISQIDRNVKIYLEIEDFIMDKINEVHGNVLGLSDEQFEALEKIEELLNVLFYTGEGLK